MDLRETLQSTLGDAYKIERELAGGGMSRVFIAEEKALGRRVVVKVLPLEAAGQLSLERFRREIAFVAQLQHPHIVPLLTAGETGGLAYFTMPFIQGETLRARLSKSGELPVNEATRILREVASALAFAHQAGVVHRDIKPDNVLLAAGASMVSDFGVAKALIASSSSETHIHRTSLGLALGTPAYMSPEQVSADPGLDHRADLYAWGILAYEMLAGSTPFSGRPAQAMLAAHVNETVEPLGRRRPNLPPALESLVMRCLEKRAADRPQSAEELVRALDEVSTPSGGVRAMSGPRFTPPGTPWMASRRRLIAALVVIAAVLVATALYLRERSNRLASSGAPFSLAAQDPKTIAVLPFDNVPADTATEYFSDGLRDEVADALSRVPSFAIVERASSISAKGRYNSVPEIGRRLDAGSVVQASVRRSGGGLNIHVDLTDTRQGRELWGHTFPYDAGSKIGLQSGIAAAIAESLQVHLGGGSTAIEATGAPDPDAHDIYLRGVSAMRRYTEPDLRQAKSLFEQAIAKDPKYAAPWAGIARVWMYLADDWLPPREAYPHAKEAAQRALALDSTNAGAHVKLGQIYEWFDWDFPKAEREFRTALREEPRNSDALRHLGNMLLRRGEKDSALAVYRKSFQMDPINEDASVGLALPFLRLNQLDSAEAILRVAHIVSTSVLAASLDAQLRLQQHRWADALTILEKPSARDMRARSLRIVAEARLGRTENARARLTALEDERKRRYVAADYIAQGYAALGDVDAAFKWMNVAFDERSGLLYDMPAMMPWDPIRRDPRWAALERRVNEQAAKH